MRRIIAAACAAVTLALALAEPVRALDSITPQAAYDLATRDPNVYILDVRTGEEWKWVGHPGMNKVGTGAGLDGKVFQVSWMKPRQGKMEVNPSFLDDVDGIFGRDPDVTLILMCRSGERGVGAAGVLEPAGYRVLNMWPAFEGKKGDFSGYRNVEGWKVEGLPYNYLPAGGYFD